MTEGAAGVRERILSRIDKKVSFKYPGSEGDKNGILKDRTVVDSTNAPGTVPYWDVVDLIEFEGEKEPNGYGSGTTASPARD
ncbi:MAG: hypothetical protein ACLP6G_20680 [Terriglobales bacterium]